MSDKLREAAQQALAELKHGLQFGSVTRASAILEDVLAQQKHKPLFAEMIAQHPGLAEELAQQDAQAVDFDGAYASTTMALVEDYAKAVHDGDDAACSVLRQTIQASLEQAALKPPAQRGCSSTRLVGLTDEEIDRLWFANASTSIIEPEIRRAAFARAVIKAYETKNGINRG